MRLGTEDRKKLPILIVVGVLALGAAYYMYTQLSTPDVPPPVAATVVTTPAVRPLGASGKAAVVPEAQLDPTLHMQAMLVAESVVYTGSGRNIFSASSAPAVEAPTAIAKTRIPDPIAPVRTVDAGPAPPPAIDLKFFGTETNAAGATRAFLLHGEDVFLASAGEIVQRRYRVISIDAHSLVVEDIANSNRQTLPLLVSVTR